MSYCRWSSDDFQSDLYVYDDINGSTFVGVCRLRVAFCEPLPPDVDIDDVDAWVARWTDVMDIVSRSKREPIGLSRDGGQYWCNSHAEAAELVQSLADEGYRVPDGVVDALLRELEPVTPG